MRDKQNRDGPLATLNLSVEVARLASDGQFVARFRLADGDGQPVGFIPSGEAAGATVRDAILGIADGAAAALRAQASEIGRMEAGRVVGEIGEA